jgi:hypothetical protein
MRTPNCVLWCNSVYILKICLKSLQTYSCTQVSILVYEQPVQPLRAPQSDNTAGKRFQESSTDLDKDVYVPRELEGSPERQKHYRLQMRPSATTARIPQRAHAQSQCSRAHSHSLDPSAFLHESIERTISKRTEFPGPVRNSVELLNTDVAASAVQTAQPSSVMDELMDDVLRSRGQRCTAPLGSSTMRSTSEVQPARTASLPLEPPPSSTPSHACAHESVHTEREMRQRMSELSEMHHSTTGGKQGNPLHSAQASSKTVRQLRPSLLVRSNTFTSVNSKHFLTRREQRPLEGQVHELAAMPFKERLRQQTVRAPWSQRILPRKPGVGSSFGRLSEFPIGPNCSTAPSAFTVMQRTAEVTGPQAVVYSCWVLEH